MGALPHPNSAACRPGGIATQKVKKRILPFLLACPYLNSGAPVTPSRGGTRTFPRVMGTGEASAFWGNPGGREEFAVRTRGSASELTAPVGPRRPAPPTPRRLCRARLAPVRLRGGAGARVCVDTCVCVCVCGHVSAWTGAGVSGAGTFGGRWHFESLVNVWSGQTGTTDREEHV